MDKKTITEEEFDAAVCNVLTHVDDIPIKNRQAGALVGSMLAVAFAMLSALLFQEGDK